MGEEFLIEGDMEKSTSMLEPGTLCTVEESTLSVVEEGSLSADEEETLSAEDEETLSAVEESTSSILQSHLSTEVQMASAAVNSTTPEEETAVSQGRSVGSSHNPSTEERRSFITCDIIQCVFHMVVFKPKRFICSLHKLLELAAGVCDVDNCGSQRNIDYAPSGCCISIFGTCANGHPFYWESSDKLGTGDQRKLLIDNLHFASAIVLSGNHYSKMEQFARFFHLNILCSASFYGYQRNFICPGVERFYKHSQVLCYAFSACSNRYVLLL